MDYPLEFRKFLSSQYLYTGIRISAGVIIPAVFLYQYEVLPTLIGIPLGALFVSLTDNPGPIRHRRNGMLISIMLCFLVILITGYARVSPFLIAIEIVLFGMFFSLIAIFGNRANSIGLITLIVFILHVDPQQGAQHILLQATFFVTGGLWYALLSLLLYNLQPYRAVEQLLGEYLMEMAEYFHIRSRFYLPDTEYSKIFTQLIEKQVRVHHLQEELRETLFSTRRFVSESTHRGRILMMIFLDSIDLLERIMTAQQDYQQLHHEFDSTGILKQVYKNIKILANTLHQVGLTIQAGTTYSKGADIDAQFKLSMESFNVLRSKSLNPSNVESFIRLRHILHSMQDLTDRILRVEKYASFDKSLNKNLDDRLDLNKFKMHREINFDLLKANLSLKSTIFRHSVRLTAGLLAGYIISFIFPFGHSYWILLTIATIIKPEYSLSKNRNIQRLVGTIAGTIVGFAILYLDLENTAIFVSMVISMIFAYSMLRVNYGVSIAGLTAFLLLSFHFLDPQGLQDVLVDRILDTAIGCILAYIVSVLVLPSWEHQQIDTLIDEAMVSNQKYFSTVSLSFVEEPADLNTFQISRNNSFVALANLSDTFQRMLSEPKSQKKYLQLYHQFVTSSHVLTSHIASLAYYSENFSAMYRSRDFGPMIKTIEKQFRRTKEEICDSESNPLPIHKKVQQLLELRKRELEGRIENESSTRKSLSDLKAITEQFRLIYSTLNDQVRILRELKVP